MNVWGEGGESCNGIELSSGEVTLFQQQKRAGASPKQSAGHLPSGGYFGKPEITLWKPWEFIPPFMIASGPKAVMQAQILMLSSPYFITDMVWGEVWCGSSELCLYSLHNLVACALLEREAAVLNCLHF